MDRHDINTYNFYLPAELIAQHPQSPRDHARLLVVDRKTGEFRDLIFQQIDELLSEQDVLVLNETRVMAARLEGRKPATGGRVEVLLLRPQGKDWVCLGRPAKRMRPGTIIEFGDGRMRGKVLADLEFAGGKLIRFEGYEDFFQTINEVGRVPLPPYINSPATGKDADDYQTVYAREYGSAAAPTAGLHFTPQLLNRIEKGGTEIIRLVLHVGLGTFRPVEAADIRDHIMHKEFYELKEEAAGKLNRARRQGKRIVAVGTTSVRVLESTHKAGEGFNAGAGRNRALYLSRLLVRSSRCLGDQLSPAQIILVDAGIGFWGIELIKGLSTCHRQ